MEKPMKTTEYLDAIKKKHHLNSDYKISKLLGARPSKIANYRNGTSFSDETALQIAKLLEIEPVQVFADMQIERAKDPEVKKTWTELSKKLGGIAATIVLTSNLQIATQNNEKNIQINDLARNTAIFCILCKIRELLSMLILLHVLSTRH